MQSQVALFRTQQVSLKGLVDNLEFLLSQTENAAHAWSQEMLSKLGVLEDTYASALDKNRGVFTSVDTDRRVV
jgi:hypothetical protein